MASNTSCAGAQNLDPHKLCVVHVTISKPVSCLKTSLLGILTC